METCNNDIIIPKIVFIVPYRDRVEHKTFFEHYIKFILEDIPKNDYEIYFVHQKDTRPFNRGAMKNIGFLAMKYKYPNDYKKITLVFHDVDTLPYKKNLIDYNTDFGVVKHYYGFYFALGGIFSIKAGDFEMTNGFPNYWAWGNEDNYMQHRVLSCGLKIDRSNFYTIRSREILHFVDGVKRLICRKEAETTYDKTCQDGIRSIRNLKYEYNEEYIDVYHFDCLQDCNYNQFEVQDITKETVIRFKKTKNMNLNNMYSNNNILQQQQQTLQTMYNSTPIPKPILNQYLNPNQVINNVPNQIPKPVPRPVTRPLTNYNTHNIHNTHNNYPINGYPINCYPNNGYQNASIPQFISTNRGYKQMRAFFS